MVYRKKIKYSFYGFQIVALAFFAGCTSKQFFEDTQPSHSQHKPTVLVTETPVMKTSVKQKKVIKNKKTEVTSSKNEECENTLFLKILGVSLQYEDQKNVSLEWTGELDFLKLRKNVLGYLFEMGVNIPDYEKKIMIVTLTPADQGDVIVNPSCNNLCQNGVVTKRGRTKGIEIYLGTDGVMMNRAEPPVVEVDLVKDLRGYRYIEYPCDRKINE